MRAALLAGAMLLATPAQAQDHSGHEGHGAQPAPAQPDHSAHQAPAPAPLRLEIAPRAAAPVNPSQVDHSQMDHGAAPATAASSPPPRAFEGPAHAADLFFAPDDMARARAASHAAHGSMTTGTLLVERLEAQITDGENAYLWDISGWYGGPLDRFVFKAEGEGQFGGAVEDAEVQALWGHAIGPFVDLQAGVRLDVEPETRAHLALGVQGLAPYMIHFDATAFVSDRGDVTARIEAEHDMRLTQRLILQPRVEFELSAQDIPERGTGAGLAHVEAGVRLRYEIAREFAPYIGVDYQAATGGSADYARAAGEDATGFALLLGVRTWF